MRRASSPLPQTTRGSESAMPKTTSSRSPWAAAATASTLSRLITASATTITHTASRSDEPARPELGVQHGAHGGPQPPMSLNSAITILPNTRRATVIARPSYLLIRIPRLLAGEAPRRAETRQRFPVGHGETGKERGRASGLRRERTERAADRRQDGCAARARVERSRQHGARWPPRHARR